MGLLFLLRHGQSAWNLENRFTGWVDVPTLTHEGELEMDAAGRKLRGVALDHVYSSALTRTRQSARLLLASAQQTHVEIVGAWELNERFYGRLQGLNKAETAMEYGGEQVMMWRRSYGTRPPGGESLEDAAFRIYPYFEQFILPQAAVGKTVLVCAHGNTLRAIMMRLDRLNAEEVMDLEIPTGGLYRYAVGTNGKTADKHNL